MRFHQVVKSSDDDDACTYLRWLHERGVTQGVRFHQMNQVVKSSDDDVGTCDGGQQETAHIEAARLLQVRQRHASFGLDLK